jgi:hypothetical protein
MSDAGHVIADPSPHRVLLAVQTLLVVLVPVDDPPTLDGRAGR